MPVKRAKNFKYEISAGAIIFIEESGGRKYLLLHYESGSEKDYWGFPKGRVEREKKESLEVAALRELEEETGLKPEDAELIPAFKEKVHYFFRRGDTLISKDSVYFIARAKKPDIKISWEHVGFEWLPYEKALERIKHKNHRELLEKAEKFLSTI